MQKYNFSKTIEKSHLKTQFERNYAKKNKFSSSQITQPVWLLNVWKISSPINRTMWKKWTVIITNWKLLLSLFHWKYTSMHLYLRRVWFGVYVDMHKRRERKKCCICCCYSSFIHNHNRKKLHNVKSLRHFPWVQFWKWNRKNFS